MERFTKLKNGALLTKEIVNSPPDDVPLTELQGWRDKLLSLYKAAGEPKHIVSIDEDFGPLLNGQWLFTGNNQVLVEADQEQ